MPPKLGAKRGTNASPSARSPMPGSMPGSAPTSIPSPPSAVLGARAKVCLRIRPALTEEEGGAENVALQCDNTNKLVWTLLDGDTPEDDSAPRQFVFDEVLGQAAGQPEMFEAVGAPAVAAALSGSIGCVITYGAAGAGKDYSMRCERPGNEGILPRALSRIFSGTDLVRAMPRRPVAP